MIWSDLMSDKDMNIKKRMMFIMDEDYYFLTYNVIFILDIFNCYSKKRKFLDYRKLSYLISFLKSQNNLEIYLNLFKDDFDISISKYEKLLNIYTKSEYVDPQIRKLLFSLERNNIVELIKDEKYGSLSLFLNKNSKVESILSSKIFSEEKSRVELMKNTYPRIWYIKFDTFLSKVFQKNGVATWAD